MLHHVSTLQGEQMYQSTSKLLSDTGFRHGILNYESRRDCCDHIKLPLQSEFHPNQFWLQLVHLGDKRDRGRNYSFKFWVMGGLTITCILLLWWNFLQCSQPTTDSQSEFVHLMSPTMVFYFSLTSFIKALINKVIFPKQPYPGATRDLHFSFIRIVHTISWSHYPILLMWALRFYLFLCLVVFFFFLLRVGLFTFYHLLNLAGLFPICQKISHGLWISALQ